MMGGASKEDFPSPANDALPEGTYPLHDDPAATMQHPCQAFKSPSERQQQAMLLLQSRVTMKGHAAARQWWRQAEPDL